MCYARYNTIIPHPLVFDNFGNLNYTIKYCPGGGIGRHAGFKIPFSRESEGSSPSGPIFLPAALPRGIWRIAPGPIASRSTLPCGQRGSTLLLLETGRAACAAIGRTFFKHEPVLPYEKKPRPAQKWTPSAGKSAPRRQTRRTVTMVRIRMQRLGRRNRPFYRISAIEKRNRRNGVVIEQLGWYDPIAKDPEKQFKINGERVQYWLSVGAQPSDTVRRMLEKNGVGKGSSS